MTLVDPQQPLILADGTKIDPATGCVLKDTKRYTEVPNQQQAQRIVMETRRKLSDLPDVPRNMNTISVVLSYSLFGLSPDEIAIATGLTEQQVGIIRMSPAFAEMQEAVVQSIMDNDAEDIRRLFRVNAKNAAHKMATLMDSSSETIQFAAAKDSLDRDGHRPSDVVEHRVKVEGGLTIEYVRRDQSDIPIIELEAEDVSA